MNPFQGKHLLLVGTGGVKRFRVLSRIRGLGLARISCLNDATNWADPLVDDWVLADPVRPSDETASRVRRQVGTPDAVYTYDDYSVVAAAHLAKCFGRVGLAPHAAAGAKDKRALRELCRAKGLPAPQFVRLEPRIQDVSAALDAAGVRFPVVVKPTHGAGSVLVRRANTHQELEAVLTDYRAKVAAEPAAALWPDRSVLVEEYLEGPEVDIDMVVQDGRVRYAAVTDNFAPVEPFFLERGGRIPSALPAGAQAELVDVATQVLSALSVADCVVHFEARWTARGAMPIEANLRLGGAEVYTFNREAFGVDLAECGVRIALGAPVDIAAPPAPLRHLRSAAFNPPRGGRIESIDVEQRVHDDPALAELVIFRQVGDTVRVPPDGFDYLGWIAARGASRAEADIKLAALVSGIRFRIGAKRFHGAFTESQPP